MKKLLLIIGIAFTVNLVGPHVLASNAPNLRVQIFPLECSLDTVALGNVISLHLTPENCLPQPPMPGQPPAGSDVSEPNPIRTPSYRFLLPSFNGSTSIISDRFVLPQANQLRTADRASHDQKNGAPHSWVVPTIATALVVATLGAVALTYFPRQKILPHSNFKPPHDD